ncbi:uncharacterized protein NPIL_61731 [Nephila pilipes]|uniref:Uncharacterized protein n=1 Tax=Nephila pilipes TaxID=299642 RepID=A0A8X6UMY4_NEPPI|nr:uncharacterized protein NPIL_61731 [Nephila pilipes]
MSHLEKETFRFLIDSLESKIAWRKIMCEIVKEDIDLYQKAYEEEKRDKKEVVNLLETAIEEQIHITQKIKSITPNVEKLKSYTEKTKSEQLAIALKEANEEISSNAEHLQKTQMKLNVLENYDANKMDQKIVDIESHLNNYNEEEVIKTIEMKESQEYSLRKEMEHIFEKRSQSYQENLKEQVDKNIERIAEEIRWWKDSGNILKSMQKRLGENIASKSDDIAKDKKELETRKKSILDASVKLQEKKNKISSHEKFNAQLTLVKENEARMQEEEKRLTFLKVNAQRNLSGLQKKFKKSIDCLEYNENSMKELGNEIATVDKFGNYLANVLESAKNIIAGEVTQTSIKTYGGPAEKKKTLTELESLFDEATKFIHENTNS